MRESLEAVSTLETWHVANSRTVVTGQQYISVNGAKMPNPEKWQYLAGEPIGLPSDEAARLHALGYLVRPGDVQPRPAPGEVSEWPRSDPGEVGLIKVEVR